MPATIRVVGLPRFLRTLQAAGVEVEDLKDTMAAVAAFAAAAVAAEAPKVSGDLSGSVRGNRAKGRATVTIGKGKTKLYAMPIHYGWPRRNIEPNLFGDRALQRIEPAVEAMLVAGYQAQLDKVKGA